MKFFILYFLFFSLNSFGQKIFVVGDIHGDYEKMLSILVKAGLTDLSGKWIAGNNILVQTGDQVDRGADDRKIIDFFEKLEKEAKNFGGKVYPMLGNHELMNSVMDFSYVEDDGYDDFKEFGALFSQRTYSEEIYKTIGIVKREKSIQGRAVAFASGGPYAKILAKRKTVLIVNGILFAHGGVLPEMASLGVDFLNTQISSWLDGTSKAPPVWIKQGNGGPLWSREYSENVVSPDICAQAKEALRILGAKYMVVGHTIQKEINSVCDGKVWRIDTGMSRGFGKSMGSPQALVYDPLSDQFSVVKI